MQALKQVNPANPFVVPNGYFEQLEGAIMKSVRLDDFKQKHPGDGFAIPDGYFDSMRQNIQSHIAIDDVLKGNDGFTLPAGYLNQAEQNISHFIAFDDTIQQKHGFTVPDAYFEQLSQNIQSRIGIEENIETDGFDVPQGYFENLETRILNQITLSQPKQKVVVRRLWASAAFKYASAACFSLVMGTAIFVSEFNSGQAEHNRSYLHKELAKIPKSDIEDYIQLNGDSPSVMENADPNDFKQADAAANQGND